MKSDGTYYLANNITLSGNWTPIEGFNGTLDGRGFVISRLTIKETLNKTAPQTAGKLSYGLFADLGSSAVVKDLKLMAVNIDIQTKNQISHVNFHLGALAGINNGIIENCHVLSGTVKTGVAADYNVTTRFNEYMVVRTKSRTNNVFFRQEQRRRRGQLRHLDVCWRIVRADR